MRVAPGRWRSTDRRPKLALAGPDVTELTRDPDPASLGVARALFFRLAGVSPGPARSRVIEDAAALLGRQPHWPDLRALARREGVSSALWPRLRRVMDGSGAAHPPPEVTEAFRREAMVGEFHARRMEARLHEVLAILASRGIEPVLLKGAGLAYGTYGGLAGRPMRDLDLLLPGEAMPVALAALRSAGWTPERPERGDAVYAGHHHAPPLTEPDGGPVVVELHVALFPTGHPFGLEGHRVIARARRLATPLGAVLVPRAVDQLLHVCTHLAWSHELRWGAWRAFADVSAILSAAAAEDASPVVEGEPPSARALDELVGEALEVRAGSSVYWTLRLAAGLSGAPVPEEWLVALRPPAASRLLARHLAHQLLPGPGVAPSVKLARAGWAAAIRPGWSGHGGSRPWRVGAAAAGARPVGGLPPVRSDGEGCGGSRSSGAAGARWRGYLRAVLG